MGKGYFQRVQERTPTRFWINNPTLPEADKAIAAGAVACTTNPAYVSKLLLDPGERRLVEAAADSAIAAGMDDSEAAGEVQRRMVARLSERFMPSFEATGGRLGFLTIQSDPYREENPSFIRDDAIRNAALAPNILCKIPSTAAGIAALAELAPRGIPVMMTEVMAVDQAIDVCETYLEATAGMAARPAFFVTHISGILDDYLRGYAERNRVEVDPGLLAQAGLAVAKRQYRILKERGYPGTMIAGGARGLHHFTELVGGDLHITINWKGTADVLIERDGDAVSRIGAEPSEAAVIELEEKLPDFRRAYEPGGLPRREYYDFGGVALFRSSFLKGWSALVDFVAARRVGVRS